MYLNFVGTFLIKEIKEENDREKADKLPIDSSSNIKLKSKTEENVIYLIKA